jgi:hypothetical protein
MGTPPVVVVDIMPKISGVEDPQDRSAERDQEAKPKDLSESPDKGLDDDLN